ncbi:rRNA maturation RNase YbeY [Mesobaculum littorinae]
MDDRDDPGRAAGDDEFPAPVDPVIEDPRWMDVDLPGEAARACAAALRHLGLEPGEWEISLLACDDARIATLNADFRAKSRPTNVLSWPSSERGAGMPGAQPDLPHPGDDPELGDIAIAYDTCAAEARAAGVPFTRHLRHLLVHATLHLLGYDHETDPDAELMERTEVAILATLGDPDPYRP